MAEVTHSGTLDATGNSGTVNMRGKFNISFSGTWTGTAALQRSFDGGTSWLTVYSTTSNAEQIGEEVEEQVLYRVGFTRSSGTLAYRISR